MTPGEVSSNPRLARQLIGIADAARAYFDAEDRVIALAESGASGDGVLWSQMNRAYSAGSDALRVLRQRVKAVKR